MSDFRNRIFGVTVAALAFTGLAYGQVTSCAFGTPATTPGPISLRAESTTELVGDGLFGCSNTGSFQGTISVFLSAPATSKLNSDNTTTAFTEASLLIGATRTFGVVSGNRIDFNNITATGNFTGQVSNVRVNASAVAVGSVVTSVTEQVTATTAGTTAATATTVVGYVFKSFNTPALAAHANGGATASVTGYTTCAGNPLPTSGNLSTTSFVVNLGESFGGAFKVGPGIQAAVVDNATSNEAGSYAPGAPTNAGAATTGTRIKLVFAGVSAGQTLYLPEQITAGTSPGLFSVHLTATEAGPFTAVPVSTTTGAPAAQNPFLSEAIGASAAFTPAADGTVTAIYEVTDTDSTIVFTFQVPVWVVFAPNAFTGSQGPITVLASYAPAPPGALATSIPSFIAPSTAALNATVVTPCQTSLLFPFVSNQVGYDTGIVLSNTSTGLGANAQPGTCTLSFYGDGAPTPSTGIAAPGGSQASGTAIPFLVGNVAPGFQGYVIATCNYQFGHGFAFLVSNDSDRPSMGYLALTVDSAARTAAPLEVLGN